MESPLPVSSFDPAVLASHVGFVRRLARGLVRGPGSIDEADDVAAEALAAAVVQQPETGASFRGWLRRVVARLANRRAVAQRRRGAREQLAAGVERAARGENELGADQVAAQIELERQVALAFAALAEPMRSTLFRRYWLDLTPTQIAAETRTPLATVKSRLQRGLELLRERLDAAHSGQRQEWLAAVTTWTSSVAIGGAVMAAKGKVAAFAVAALLLAGATIVVLEPWNRGSHDGSALPNADPAVAAVAAVDATFESTTAGEASTTVAAERSLDPDTLPFAAGVVVDAMYRPIAGVRVVPTRLLAVPSSGGQPGPSLYEWPMEFYGSSLDGAAAVSDGEGRFVLPRPRDPVGALWFVKEGFGLEVARDFATEAAGNQELRVTLAPEQRVRGTVRESDGGELALAEIWVLDSERGASTHQMRKLVAHHLPGAPEYMAAPELVLHKARCDAKGRFDLRCIPDRPFEAIAKASGFSTVTALSTELPDPWEPVLVRSELLLDVVDAATGEPLDAACAIVVARGTGVVQAIANPIQEQFSRADQLGLQMRRVGGRLSVDVNYPRGGLTWLLIAPDQTVDATIHIAAVGYRSATVDTPITAKVEPPHLRVELVPDAEQSRTLSFAGRVDGPDDSEVALFAVQGAVHGIDPTDLLRFPPHLVARCESDGAFAFPELPRGDYLLLARAKGCAPVRADVTAPRLDLRFTLDAATSLEVVVTDSRGKPPPAAIVHVQDAAGKQAWTARADGTGVARFEKLPASRLRALAVAMASEGPPLSPPTGPASLLPDELFAEEETVDARAGEPARLEVRAIERRPVALHFRHDDGTPATDVKLEYSGASQGLSHLDRAEDKRLRKLRVAIDARGDATVDLYPGGHWFLAVQGRIRESEKVVVPREGAANATFLLPVARPFGTLSGRIAELGGGAPIVGRDIRVQALRPNGRSNVVGTATTDAEGRYSIVNVPSGDVLVEAMAHLLGGNQSHGLPDPDSAYRHAQHRTKLEAGRDTVVDFELPPVNSKSATFPMIALDACVRDAATGSPIEGATIHVQVIRDGTQLDIASPITAADGRAHADVFAAEKYLVYVLGPSDPKTLQALWKFVKLDLNPEDGVLTIDAELTKLK